MVNSVTMTPNTIKTVAVSDAVMDAVASVIKAELVYQRLVKGPCHNIANRHFTCVLENDAVCLKIKLTTS